MTSGRRLAVLTVGLMAGLGAGAWGQGTQGARLLVVSQANKSVSVVDPVTNRQVAVVDERQTTMHGHEVAAGPDHRTMYVPIYGNVGVGKPGLDGDTILAMDVPTGKIVQQLKLTHGVRPHDPVYLPSTGLLYVTAELDKQVLMLDPKTLEVVGTVPTGDATSHMLAMTPDGRRGYTANVVPGTVSVLDFVQRRTVKVIPVAKGVQRISLSPDSRWVFTSDTAQPRLAVIDTSRNEVARWIDLPGVGYGSAVTPDGRWLVLALPQNDAVGVINLTTFRLERTVPVAKTPQEVLIRPDGRMAYVSGRGGNQVSVVDLSTWKEAGRIDVGAFPDGLAWMQ